MDPSNKEMGLLPTDKKPLVNGFENRKKDGIRGSLNELGNVRFHDEPGDIRLRIKGFSNNQTRRGKQMRGKHLKFVLDYIKRQKDNANHDRTYAIQIMEQILNFCYDLNDQVQITYYYDPNDQGNH